MTENIHFKVVNFIGRNTKISSGTQIRQFANKRFGVYIPTIYRNIFESSVSVLVRADGTIIMQNPLRLTNRSYKIKSNNVIFYPLNNNTEHLEGEYEVEVDEKEERLILTKI